MKLALRPVAGTSDSIGSPPSAWTLAAAVALAVGAAAVAGIVPFRPPGRLPAVTILGP